MSLFDQNQWYQITVPKLNNESMAGLKGDPQNTAAAVFFQSTNTSSPAQRWQIWHTDNDTYVLRSQASGPTGYLAVRANTTTESHTGGTTAITRQANVAGGEAFWKMNTFSNGGLGMGNLANGTDWGLFAKDEAGNRGRMAMTNNIKGEQDNQSFKFKKIEKIDDPAFSTLQTPTATPQPTGGSSQSPDSPNTTLPTFSGLSTGGKVAIGASVGAVVLIALIIGLLFFQHRRRHKQSSVESPIAGGSASKPASSYDGTVKYSHSTEQGIPQELGQQNAASELDGGSRMNELDGGRTLPAELPGSHAR
ncbi:hypothetical protein CC80DRAFT_118553 [Byssothecium circinans]|uniref:Ricin B lectin domain-containing protein n=1 Tax=Byssothecium circinans TaxID=147558 RepID=A0A6A5TQD6_9PLEO|nr:hypothetical protein CC80DRAFT_118553 [Byssothecium circinans]